MADASQIPSMYGNASQGMSNPLTQLHTFAQTQNLINTNIKFQQEQKFRQAIGPILQQAYDPTTKIVDPGKLVTGMAANPDTSMFALQHAQEAFRLGILQQNAIADTLKTEGIKRDVLADAAVGLLNKYGPQVKMEHVLSALADPGVRRVVPEDEFKQMIKGLVGGQVKDGPELQQFLTSYVLRQRGASEGIKRLHGDINNIGIGGETATQRIDPMTGKPRVIGSIAHTPTPAERNTMEAITVDRDMAKAIGKPEGTVIYVPRAATGPMQTGTGETAAGTGGVPPSNAPLPQNPVKTQTYRQGPNGELITTPTKPDVNVGNTTVAGKDQAQVPVKALDPYRAKAIAEVAEKYETKLNKDIESANAMKALIIGQKEAAANFRPGGLAEFRMKFAQAVQGLPGATDNMVKSIGNGSLEWSQVFDKLGVQGSTIAIGKLIHEAGGRLAVQEWNRFQQAWPNLNTDPKAISKMLDFMEKLSNMTLAEKRHFDEYKDNPRNDLTKWQGIWSDKVSKAFDNYWEQVQKKQKPK